MGATAAPGAASLPFLLKQSLSHFLQLQAGSNGYTLVGSAQQARYFDNVFFGPKLNLVDQGDIVPSLAVSAQASLPDRADAAGYARARRRVLRRLREQGRRLRARRPEPGPPRVGARRVAVVARRGGARAVGDDRRPRRGGARAVLLFACALPLAERAATAACEGT